MNNCDKQYFIRNFAIIAHIDHGKSTLADRLLELTKTIDPRNMVNQVLDSNPIERERGITIKLAPVRIKYNYQGKNYILNLIDTPGHVDFSYEVSRTLSACEGVILVVDATKGIQAQTIAHMQLVNQKKLAVIPVINKIDLDTAKILLVKKELTETFNFKEEDIIEISAKQAINIDQVIKAVIEKIPPPSGDKQAILRGLIFSSRYNTHQGVVVFVKLIDGQIDITKITKNHSQLYFIASNTYFSPLEIGVFTPSMKSIKVLSAGEVGYIATGLKDISLAQIGDTLTLPQKNIAPLPGYKEPKPMVFVNLYPTDTLDFPLLRSSLEKLHLADSSFQYKIRSSLCLGKGFLCGFLGLLHAEIVKERLEKEFKLNLISSAPSVEYLIRLKNSQLIKIQSPEDFPDQSQISEIEEPIMQTTIITPQKFLGDIMQLCENKRGEFINLEYFANQAKLSYFLPLSEMIIDFFDKLKSISSGYASLDYEFYQMRKVNAVKLEILLNKKKIEAFSQIVVKENAHKIANKLVEKLKLLIPKHQFQIPIQAVIQQKVIARSDIKAFRKDVTAKLYGGDRTRKDKLLEAQKKGKKKMRQFGEVKIPQEIFLKLYQEEN